MSKAVNNAFYYTIGAIIKASTSFVLLPLFANKLGAEQYGVFNLLTTFSVILVTLMTLATERSLYRLYYDYHADEEKVRFLSTVLWTIIGVSVFVIIVTAVTGSYIVRYIDNVDVWRIFMPTVIYTFFAALINFSQILMQVEQLGNRYLQVSVATLVVYNCIALVCLYFYSPTVESLVIASFIANAIILPYALYRMRRLLKPVFDISMLKETLKFSMPVFGMIVFAWVLNMTDRLFIANMANLKDAGIYSLASKFIQAAILFTSAVFQAYGPYFYKTTNTNNDEAAKKILEPVNRFITLVVCGFFIVVICVTKPILFLFFTEEYNSSIIYVFILGLSAMMTQQSGLLNLMVYQNKKTVAISLITVFCGIVSVVMNMVLIPRIGSIAAAYSNLTVGVLMFLLTWLLAKRNYYINFDFAVMVLLIMTYVESYVIDCIMDNLAIALLLKVFLYSITFLLGVKFNILRRDELAATYHKIVKPAINKLKR